MPQAGTTRGNAGRSTRSARRKARRYTPPPPPAPVQRGHASEGGRVVSRRNLRPVSRTDAQRGYGIERANAFKRTPQYRADLLAARRARIRRSIRRHEVIPRRTSMAATRGRPPDLPSLNQIADFIAKHAYIPNTGGGPNLGGRGFRTPRGSATALAPPAVHVGGGKVGRNFVRDLVNLGPGTVVGGISLGRAGVSAVKGDTDPLETLARETAKGLVETVRHPVRSFKEHPLDTALTFGGATSVAGRGLGAVARGAGRAGARGPRGALARAGTTVRPPIALVDDAGLVRKGQGVVERTYSKDITRATAQRARDAKREKLRDADGKVVTVRQRGREVPVLKATTKEREGGLLPVQGGGRPGRVREQANFESARANAVERRVRHEADKQLRTRGVRGKRSRDAVAVVVEGTIRSAKTFEVDLRRHISRLEREYRARIGDDGFRHSGEAAANRARVAQMRALLKTTPKQRAAIVAAGKSIGRELNTREKGLLKAGVLSSSERARRARLIPAAIEHLGARYNKATDTIVGPKGQRLTTEAIERGLRQVGIDPDEIAYLPHRMDVRGRRAFHAQFRPGTRPVMDKPGKRTGEAYRKGATESSEDLIREHGVRQAVQLAKAQQLDRLVQNSGLKHPSGDRYFSWKEAEELTERIDYDSRIGSDVFVLRNGQRMVPMRAYAARLSKETQRIIEEERQGPGAMENLHQQLLNDRILHQPEKGRNARNVVLVPAAKIEQLQKQLAPAGDIEKFFQLLNRPFRMAVLPQPRWLTGNFAEPFVVRLTLRGSGVNVFGLGNDLRAAHKALRSMERSGDPKVRAAAEELRAQQFGGLFVGGGQARAVRRGVEDFPRLERAYGQMVAKLPVTKQAVEILATGGRLALFPLRQFFHLNRVIESTAQRAAFGKQFRADLQEFTGSWSQTIRLQEKAVAEAARGLVNTPTQQRFMREQHVLLGKYEGFGPTLRRWIQGPMPFLPWALNAARFVYWTMPTKHTAVQAVLTQTNQVVSKDWEDEHRDLPPGNLRYALPNGKGGWIDLARYTPWGAITDTPQTATGEFAPHLQGAFKASQGQDPFGRELKLDPTENAGETATTGAQRAGIAANSLAEALVPYLSTARRLREKGGTAYAGSTVFDPDVKPETVGQMSPLNRVFNPFRPTYFGAGPTRTSVQGATPRSTDPVDRALEQIAVQSQIQAEQDAAIDEALRRLGR